MPCGRCWSKRTALAAPHSDKATEARAGRLRPRLYSHSEAFGIPAILVRVGRKMTLTCSEPT